MNDTTTETYAGANHPARTRGLASAGLILAAWAVMLLLSKLPLVIARDFLGADIPWITPAWLILAGVFYAGSFVLPVLAPLRRYILVMGAILLLAFVVHPAVTQSAAWRDFFVGQPEIIAVFGERVLLTLMTFILILVALLSGMSRQAFFLRVGSLRAPLGGQARPSARAGLSWVVFGPEMAALLGGLFFTFLTSQYPDWRLRMAAAAAWFPAVLLGAALNAFVEEVMYRAVPLGALFPALGATHAILLTSLWFGLGHYYGGFPSGVFGLVYSGLLAVLLGKAMLDTRGLGWSWFIHVTIDTVIYLFIAGSPV